MDVSSTAVAHQAAQTQTTLEGLALKNAAKADQELISVIQEVAASAPPPGTGQAVDMSV